MNPIGKKILAELLVPENKTEAGIFTVVAEKRKAVALKIGNRVEAVKPGDTLVLFDHQGVEVEFEGKNCIIVVEDKDIETIL